MAPLYRTLWRLARLAPIALLLALILAGPTLSVALAEPAAFEASFRDLPTSVRAGDMLTVQVATQSGTTCDGTITYRGGGVQTLGSLSETDRRCRWDVSVPTAVRRGTADISVHMVTDGDEGTIAASIEVTSRGDDVDAVFRALPGTARRGEQVTIRADVTDGSTCQGSIVYDDGRAQALAAQTESRERCRWDAVVATDAPYGPAKVALTVTQGTGQTTLQGSFEVGRRSDDAQVLVGIKDLATTVRGDGAYIIRALVPDHATCSGSVVYHGASQTLEDKTESDGECTWTAQVPSDARSGSAEVSIKVQKDNDSVTTIAGLTVGGSSDVDASFRSLPGSIRRGETLEIRVTVPNGASCDGSLAYQDNNPQPLGAQSEQRERCAWEVKVPSNAPRGTATVRVTVTDGTDSTTLVSSVEILSKDGD